MNLGSLRGEIRTWLKRSDLSDSQVDTIINIGMDDLEFTYNFNDMTKETTGMVTSSDDTFDVPSDYKMVSSLFLTANEQQILLVKSASYKALINEFPHADNFTAIPEKYAIDEANDKFIVRPYPGDDYDYELQYYGYSADLSDSNPTNFWTEKFWTLLLFNSLRLGEHFTKNAEDIAIHNEMFNMLLDKVIKTEKLEKTEGSYRHKIPHLVV
jgi:hypothetical protein